METIGNRTLLDAPNKVAFLSSRKIAPDDVLRCYDWAAKVRDSDDCIISGFQSPLEKEKLGRHPNGVVVFDGETCSFVQLSHFENSLRKFCPQVDFWTATWQIAFGIAKELTLMGGEFEMTGCQSTCRRGRDNLI